MNRPKPRTGYKLLGQIAAIISAELEKMSDQELADIKDCATSLTTTNCGWTEYGLRNILRDMADSHMRHRLILFEQAKETLREIRMYAIHGCGTKQKDIRGKQFSAIMDLAESVIGTDLPIPQETARD